MSSAIPIPKKSSKKTSSSSSSSPSPGSSDEMSSPSTSSNSPSSAIFGHRRRQSLLSSSLSKQEHTVFDLGTRDGTARLVTCVKAGQGFDWNQEMFLPHHSDITVPPLSDRVDIVHEIILDDEDDGFMDIDNEREKRRR
ncbi:hypothetical protein TWF225_011764 [Orbilia oligospora]|uniref:Uncharacterized protein n=1 Tax=Orbilia oligospora TaxID=2813651 RepID=A0A7C8R2B4_ORBOL|nr:hypothetical protein TWF225_011764 [Orbilia oligospora]KAF3231805.1 hypothetical protein TWF128_004493 [Orbilia oligospora]KAF3248061.1 hypothetical protein TWF217_009508 [Orbilia oligospora]KAF3271377.1 hypothetical protein TWF970_010259 [Orbilia oligospora]KAF3274078.1 hypothetical protein TWF132_003960 [Orbilia oligospora]